jgi:signal peptidase
VIVLVVLGIVGAGAWMWRSGYRAYIIHTGSMSPTYKPGSLVIDQPARDGYRRGDVITFRHSGLTTDVVTHRITDVTSTGLVHTKGDGNRTADVWSIRPNQVQGKVTQGIPFAGYVIVYLKQPAGIASVVTVAVALLLLWGLCFPPNADPAADAVQPEPEQATEQGRDRWTIARARAKLAGQYR